jgi:hypothetical protein
MYRGHEKNERIDRNIGENRIYSYINLTYGFNYAINKSENIDHDEAIQYDK